VIPEIGPLAHLALEHCSVIPDVIVDERAPAYPPGGKFEAQDLTTEGYAALLRIERGRVHNREIFGPVRLHYGFFKLQARSSHYLIAREQGSVAGAIGFTDRDLPAHRRRPFVDRHGTGGRGDGRPGPPGSR
jgi:hypothetical protein